MLRLDNRAADQIRPVKMTRNFMKYAEGSCLIEQGDTKVICTASVQEEVPPFRQGQGVGWLTAEYDMLPRSCDTRNQRSVTRLRPDSRGLEIQRLIGRALRSVVDLGALGERTLWIDCDVIQADGGTRTASITGAYVAVVDALKWLQQQGHVKKLPISDHVAAVSVGIVSDTPILDLNYLEDSTAAVDMNVVMTGRGQLIEVQGTAERRPFSRRQLNEMLDLAEKGIRELVELQKRVLGE
jgi:ribonuclease PH